LAENHVEDTKARVEEMLREVQEEAAAEEFAEERQRTKKEFPNHDILSNYGRLVDEGSILA